MASTTSSTRPYNVAIVGGGISGLTLAITLLQHDVPITIYEAAANFCEIGAGVGLGPNAGRAMELMSPKIHKAFKNCMTENQWEDKRNSWFTIRVGDVRKADKDGFVREGKKIGDALFDVPINQKGMNGGVYRAHFLDELVESIPEGIAKFNKRLVEIKEADDGSGDIVLHFADGSKAQHNAVVACDGIKSLTRKWLLGKDDPATTPVFSGKYVYRACMPMDEATDLLGAEVAQNAQLFLGYHGHLLTYPVAHGDIMNVVAFASRDTWEDEKWVLPASKEAMAADFKDWGPHVQKVIGAMQKPDIWALFMHLPASTYTKGRVCLMGDAAHATTPNQGAGAGMCVEDSYILANLIGEARTMAELPLAFQAYDKARRERTQKVVVTSFEAGRVYDFEWFGDDLDKIEENCMTRMRWIWEIDLEKQLEDAKKMFHDSVKASATKP